MNKQRNLVWYKTPIRWLFDTPLGNFWLLALLLCSATAGMVYYVQGEPQRTFVTYIKVLWPVVVVASIMWAKIGNPLKWWYPFFGYEMKADQEKIAKRERAGETAGAVQQEIKSWVEEMSTSGWIEQNPYSYKFLRKRDAAMFKLAWG